MKRYDPDYGYNMCSKEHGEYVAYTDAAALEAENEILREQVAELQEFDEQFCLELAHDCGFAISTADDMPIEAEEDRVIDFAKTILRQFLPLKSTMKEGK